MDFRCFVAVAVVVDADAVDVASLISFSQKWSASNDRHKCKVPLKCLSHSFALALYLSLSLSRLFARFIQFKTHNDSRADERFVKWSEYRWPESRHKCEKESYRYRCFVSLNHINMNLLFTSIIFCRMPLFCLFSFILCAKFDSFKFFSANALSR